MINAISPQVNIPYSASNASSAASAVTGGAEIATLQRELVSYDKQLSEVQDGTAEAGPIQTQLLSAQVSLLTDQIVSLSGVTPLSFTQPAPASPGPVGQPPQAAVLRPRQWRRPLWQHLSSWCQQRR